MFRITAFFVFLAFILFPSLSEGDILVLKKGRKIEGEVTKKGNYYLVRTPSGVEARFPAREVQKVIAKESPRQIVQKKRDQLNSRDYRSRMKLARYCQQKGLADLARELYREVIQIKSNHYPARKALGFVRYKGQWLKKKEYLKKIGYTTHKGKWLTKEKKKEMEERKRKRLLYSRILFEVRQTLILGTSSEKKRLRAKLEKKFTRKVVLESCQKMLKDSSRKARLFAINYLKESQSRRHMDKLTDLMVWDKSGSVRRQAYMAVKSLGGPPEKSLGKILSGLNHPTPQVRFAALGAVNAFQIKKALPILYNRIGTVGQELYLPRSHSFFGTYRAYIRDYELGSAGTQQQGQAVPDPQIGYFMEGVMVETQIVEIEYRLIRTTIRRLRY